MGEFIRLACGTETLRRIATGLMRYGPAEGVPDWLVSGVWLCTDDGDYLATASAEVLGNGYVARPLNLHDPDELMRQIRADLPDLKTRLAGRNGNRCLPDPGGPPAPPSSLRNWPVGPYSTQVLVRVSQRQSAPNRVACGLIFDSASTGLLVGTDPSTLAIVFSEEPSLIARYREDCEALSAEDYLDRFSA